jgi:hypothetical protein
MDCSGFRYSRHAIERMFQRGITPEVVEGIVREGDVIASYPDDTPFPSTLILGFGQGQPVHVVAARDPATRLCHVITVYRPDRDGWSDDFRTRRQP